MPAWPTTTRRAGSPTPGSIRTTSLIRDCRRRVARRSDGRRAAGNKRKKMSWFDQRPDDAMMGSFEAVGHEHIHTVESAQFREAMSQLGAAVHVVTTAGLAGTAGFTATAVCSVSDQPATLLVCLNRRSQVTPILDTNRVLCVNTLRAGADEL